MHPAGAVRCWDGEGLQHSRQSTDGIRSRIVQRSSISAQPIHQIVQPVTCSHMVSQSLIHISRAVRERVRSAAFAFDRV